uniref:DNA helicase n=1 Tax=Tanacetum cinerariifolium TaxID=118510 RepID=A0A6L2JKQ1_TANCI|nr:DNA helicase [Tanacetum cinerariifolium]
MKTKRKLVPKFIGTAGHGTLDNNQNEGVQCIPLDTNVIVPVQQSFAEDVSGSKRRCIRATECVSSSNVPTESLNGSGHLKRKCSHGLGNLNEDGQNVEAQHSLASDIGDLKRKCSHALGNLNEDGQCLPLDRDVNIFGRQIPVEDVGSSKRKCVRQLHSVEMLQGDSERLGVASSVIEIPSDMNVDAPDVQMFLAPQQPETNNSLGVSDSVSHSFVPLLPPRGFTEGTFQSYNHFASSTLPSYYKLLGKYEQSCEYCGALFWHEERFKSVGKNRRPKYGRCCAHIDEYVNNGRGPYAFKISGTRRLFQQYIVTAFCAIEQDRIDYIREHQNDIRNEYLSRIYDAINRGDNDGSDCDDNDGSDYGARLILPQLFIGGPRYMYSHYLDALAICRVHGNPSFFITFTCNVKCPDITDYMDEFPLLTTTDRVDIVDRVFEMNIQQFIKFLQDAQPFGKIVEVLYTVEFQKRVDVDPECHRIISKLMMYGPCGLAYPSVLCMQNVTECRKYFPKEYCNHTYTDKEGFVHYRRRDTRVTILKQHIELDNRFVVPYNRTLLTKFYAHINVEYCGWTMLIKYMFRYISNGTDRIAARISRDWTTTHEDFISKLWLRHNHYDYIVTM